MIERRKRGFNLVLSPYDADVDFGVAEVRCELRFRNGGKTDSRVLDLARNYHADFFFYLLGQALWSSFRHTSSWLPIKAVAKPDMLTYWMPGVQLFSAHLARS